MLPTRLASLLQNAPSARHSVRVGEILARELLLQEFEKLGVRQDRAEHAFQQLMSEATKLAREDDATSGSAEAFVAAIDQALSFLSDVDPRAGEMVARADDIASKQVEPRGWGSEAAILSRSIFLGMSLLLIVAKLEGKIDLHSWQGDITLVEGIPAGTEELVIAAGKVISSALTAAGTDHTDHGTDDRPPDDDGSKTTKSDSNIDQAPARAQEHGPSASQGTEIIGGGATHASTRVPSTSGTLSWDRGAVTVDHDTANHAKTVLLEKYHDGEILNRLSKFVDDGAFLGHSAGFGKVAKHPWPFKHPIAIGAGVVPVKVSGRTEFRLAVRLQSRRQIRPKIFRQITDFFDQTFGVMTTTRWCGEVASLALNPNGDYKPWKGRRNALAIGAPINIPAGCVGAASLFLTNDRKDRYLLTAGHTLHDDDGRHADDPAVHFPPQPFDRFHATRIGDVDGLEIFPSARLGATLAMAASPTPPAPDNDYAIVKLLPGHYPKPSDVRAFGDRKIDTTMHRFSDSDVIERRTALKGAAKTAECGAIITSTSIDLEFYDQNTSRIVRARNLVELSADPSDHVEFGDSGALVCVDIGPALRPAGILVAAAQAGKLPSTDAKYAPVLYVLPLTSIGAIDQMEIQD